MQFSNIKARRQNQNIFHKVCLYIPIIRYTFSNLIIFIVQILIIFQLFCICIKGVIYNQRLEVRENNESLDTIVKDHVLPLMFVEILKGQKTDYFLKLDKYGCYCQFSVFFTNKDNVRTGKQTSAMFINEIHHSETKTKTKTIYHYISSFDQFMQETKSETKWASETI